MSELTEALSRLEKNLNQKAPEVVDYLQAGLICTDIDKLIIWSLDYCMTKLLSTPELMS